MTLYKENRKWYNINPCLTPITNPSCVLQRGITVILDYFRPMLCSPFIMCEQLLPDLNSPKQSVEKRDNLKNWNSPRVKFAADPQRGRNEMSENKTERVIPCIQYMYILVCADTSIGWYVKRL